MKSLLKELQTVCKSRKMTLELMCSVSSYKLKKGVRKGNVMEFIYFFARALSYGNIWMSY